MPQQVTPPTKLVTSRQAAHLGKLIFLRMRLTLGTGVFVGLGIATIAAGNHVIAALTLAALLALLHSAGEAQLTIPLSYPSTFSPQTRWLQFIADGALFLTRLTTAATAVLGIAGYLLSILPPTDPVWLVPTALISLVLLSIAARHRRTIARFSRLLVMIGLIALVSLILGGLPQLLQNDPSALAQTGPYAFMPTLAGFLQATAFMTVAYAGFESLISQPTLPSIQQTLKATRLTIGFIWLLLLGVAAICMSTVGPTVLGNAVQTHVNPLVVVMASLGFPGGIVLIIIGAVAALAGIVLALLPKLADRTMVLIQPVDGSATWPLQRTNLTLSPKAAWMLVTVAIGCIALVGDVKLLWSYSAGGLLIHYALIHALAFQNRQIRLYSRWLNGIGLGCSVFLIFWLDWTVWLVCFSLVALGLLWHGITQWSEEEE